MREEITRILQKHHNNELNTELATNRLMLLVSIGGCFTIYYHSSYAIWDNRNETIIAKDENEALEKFWNFKNKESWEIERVVKLK